MFHGNQRLRLHISGRQFAGRLSLPINVRFPDFTFCLFRYVKRIGASTRHRVKFRLQPFIRKFGIRLASSRSDSAASHHQFLISYNNRNIFQNMGKRLCPAYNNRLVFRLFIRFRNQPCSGRLDLRHFRKQVGNQPVDSCRFLYIGNLVLIQSHNTSPSTALLHLMSYSLL